MLFTEGASSTINNRKTIGKWWFLMGFDGIYPLVMTNIAMVKPWPIEIDDFPSYKPPFRVDSPWLC